MYNPQITHTRIKQRANELNIEMKKISEICGIHVDTIAKAGKSGSGMKAANLYLIAEVLECSVDYLLGRTDEPSINKGSTISNSGVGINIQGDNNANMQITVNKPEDNSLTLLELINKMPEIERARLIVQIDNIYNKKNTEL